MDHGVYTRSLMRPVVLTDAHLTRKSCTRRIASSAVRLRRDGVTWNFDLLTQKRNQVIPVPRCTSDKSLAKIRQQTLEISRKHKTTT